MEIQNLQPLTYIIISIIFVFGTGSIFLRLYCRMFLLKTFGWDDMMAIFLLAVNTMQQAILYIFLHYGCGIHVGALSGYQLEKITLWLFIEEIFYMFTHWTIKQAFLLFYLRLSPSVTFQRCVYATMALNTTFTIINWLLAFLQCRPFASIFNRAAYPDAVCINPLVILMGPSVLNIITDVIILALPIPTVMSLQMSLRRKIAVLSVIGFGASAVIIAFCRFIILHELGTNPDVSYVLGKMVLVAALEIQFAVIAVNLPSMKALWTKLTGGSTLDSNGVSGEAGGYSNSKGYKLSTIGGQRSREKHSKQGSTARALAITSTESEEELFRQNNIKVTTDVAVTALPKAGSDDGERHFGYNGVAENRF